MYDSNHGRSQDFFRGTLFKKISKNTRKIFQKIFKKLLKNIQKIFKKNFEIFKSFLKKIAKNALFKHSFLTSSKGMVSIFAHLSKMAISEKIFEKTFDNFRKLRKALF